MNQHYFMLRKALLSISMVFQVNAINDFLACSYLERWQKIAIKYDLNIASTDMAVVRKIVCRQMIWDYSPKN